MPHIYIDGKRLEAKNGSTIIETAYSNGLDIPHFCWHPELSVAGNCRMCLVEVGMPKRLADGSTELDSEGHPIVQYFPKLQIACATQIADGMYVRTKNEKAVKAQEAVMEFLLINHPLDCPICDEAGQCKLQEYAFDHSRGESRFEETKNHKDKRVPWGPNVLYDAERCISCSRCIRFAKEVAKQNVLSFVQRGDHVTIKVADGAEFDNDYSMNVIDICPVGALTSPDFRFKSRVWDMSFNDSVCTGCSRGCNIQIGIRNNEILRIEPKTNMLVNKYWMCDYARTNIYKKINDFRITEPMIRKSLEQEIVGWDDAIHFAASKLKSFKPNDIMIIASAKTSLENNFALSKFAKLALKTSNIFYIPNLNDKFEDNLLKTKDMQANSAGCEAIGITTNANGISSDNLAEKIQSGHIKALYVMDEDFNLNDKLLNSFKKLNLLIVHSSNKSRLTEMADVVFASSTIFEMEGTLVNVNNRVQYFEPALVTKENLQRMGMKMSRLDKFGASNDRWTQKETRNCRPAWRVISMLAKLFSQDFKYSKVEDIFDEIARSISLFKDFDYEKIQKHRGLILGKAAATEKVEFEYESHYKKPN